MARTGWSFDSELSQRPKHRRGDALPRTVLRAPRKRTTRRLEAKRPLRIQPMVIEGTVTRVMNRTAWWRTSVAFVFALGFFVWPRTDSDLQALSKVQSAGEVAGIALARITGAIVRVAEVLAPEKHGNLEVTKPVEVQREHPPVITSPIPAPQPRSVVLVEEVRSLEAQPLRPIVRTTVQQAPRGFVPPSKALQRMSAKLEKCYVKTLSREPAFEGDATVALTVGKGGAIERSRVIEQSFEDEKLTTCMQSVLEGAKFPRRSPSGKVQMALRFEARS